MVHIEVSQNYMSFFIDSDTPWRIKIPTQISFVSKLGNQYTKCIEDQQSMIARVANNYTVIIRCYSDVIRVDHLIVIASLR